MLHKDGLAYRSFDKHCHAQDSPQHIVDPIPDKDKKEESESIRKRSEKVRCRRCSYMSKSPSNSSDIVPVLIKCES